MIDINPTTRPLLIPRFASNLNALAKRHGLSVEVAAEPYDDNPELRLWGHWRGTSEQLLSLRIFKPSQHLPVKKGQLDGSHV